LSYHLWQQLLQSTAAASYLWMKVLACFEMVMAVVPAAVMVKLSLLAVSASDPPFDFFKLVLS
jgi:hypothetical protein